MARPRVACDPGRGKLILARLLARLIITAICAGTGVGAAAAGESAPPRVAEASAPAAPTLPESEIVAIAAAHVSDPLRAHWGRAAGPGPRPAVLLLHGCGGLYRRDAAALSARHAAMRDLLRAQGWHVLALDSFSSRGVREICTTLLGQRTIGAKERKHDALAALGWLAAQPEVDPKRIAVIGWSHGGSATLNALNVRDPEVRAAPRPAIATAFYPGCSAALRNGWAPAAPTAIYIGELDDWTPAAPCVELGRITAGLDVQLYPGAYHGFDDPANPVRVRTDVPNGVRPGAGVTVGGDPAARAAAYAHLLARMHAALD